MNGHVAHIKELNTLASRWSSAASRLAFLEGIIYEKNNSGDNHREKKKGGKGVAYLGIALELRRFAFGFFGPVIELLEAEVSDGIGMGRQPAQLSDEHHENNDTFSNVGHRSAQTGGGTWEAH